MLEPKENMRYFGLKFFFNFKKTSLFRSLKKIFCDFYSLLVLKRIFVKDKISFFRFMFLTKMSLLLSKFSFKREN